MRLEFHIGIDDTDSPTGGCTTYIMALVTNELKSRGFEINGYPCLVRLNPNVPWKTRGNAALALHLIAEKSRLAEAREVSTRIVKETSTASEEQTDPALVFLEGLIPDVLHEFYREALTDIVPVKRALEAAESIGAETFFLKGKQGIVGALACIGADLDASDHTYELIAYRTTEKLGTPRKVDPKSVMLMDEKMHGRTYNNLDRDSGRILIAPHGPDPVLVGIRGETPESIIEAFSMIQANEPVERIQVFKTNQGTDAHLQRSRNISSLRANQSGNIKGKVASFPVAERGGHVFFQLEQNGLRVDCAAFEPTGPFRRSVLQLAPGDYVRAYGAVRRGRKDHEWMFNLEKMEVLSLAESTEARHHKCTKCDGTLESMGKGQGMRCRKCKTKFSATLLTEPRVPKPRALALGMHIPPPSAHRHLTKPVSRL